jgi:hypothetical protein
MVATWLLAAVNSHVAKGYPVGVEVVIHRNPDQDLLTA